MPVIRRAMVGEAQALTAIAVAAKAHWLYPSGQIDAWRADLAISAQDIAATPVFVAELDGNAAGFFQLLPQGDTWVLEHLWVLPEHMRKGLGRALLQHAAGLAAEGGATLLSIDADPHAEAFYAACGAQTVGHAAAPIAGMPGRVRPQMVLPLTD